MAESMVSLEAMGINMPNVSASMMTNIVMWVIGVVLGCAVIGGLIYAYFRYKKYNKVIQVFGKINGAVVPIMKERAMFERVGIAGDYWCRTMKSKKILPRPSIAMGKNTYWYFVREDGEWINFSLKDIDADMKQAGTYFVDEDMRLQRLGIQKNIKDRFGEKPSFWDKYGAILGYVLFILIITISLIMLFKQLDKVAVSMNSASSNIGKLAEATMNMVARQTSGVVPA